LATVFTIFGELNLEESKDGYANRDSKRHSNYLEPFPYGLPAQPRTPLI
jgi:hypothetical protein